LQRQDPKAKLSQAQYEIARKYGFASWAKLKSHIESLPQPMKMDSPGIEAGARDVSGGIFPRFTLRSRRVVFFARYYASVEHDSETIEPEHLLLGLLQEDNHVLNRLLATPAASGEVREEIRKRVARRRNPSARLSVPLSAASKRLLELAAGESDRLQHKEIATGHLLLGFLGEESSLAGSILMDTIRKHGMTLDKARREIAANVSEEPQS
jgi:ATP-dependent Clp protease ATP-binding subunit ClpA